MPEIRFQVEWPDGSQELCYSPSLIVQEYFTAGSDYTLEDFVERSRTALLIASDRVLAKYGVPCGKALGQLQHIEAMAANYHAESHAKYKGCDSPRVRLIRFLL